jgi:multidrug resistance efflux pump
MTAIWFKKGQSVVRNRSAPYQADQDRAQGEYDQADASLKLATAEYDRAKQLREKGATSAGDFDKSSAFLPEGPRRASDGSRRAGACQT